MEKFVILLCCFAVFGSVLTLKCYDCVSKPNSNYCNDLTEKKAEEKVCGTMTGDAKSVACLKKVVYDNKLKKENVTRSCVVVKEKDITCKSSMPDTEVKFCETCTDDLCNSAHVSNLGVATIFGATVSFFFVRHVIY